MADYSAYGPVVDKWQAYVEVDVALAEASATITVRTYFHSINNGFAVNAYGWAYCGGNDSGAQQFLASAGYGESVYQQCATVTKTVQRGGSDQQVYCDGTVQIYGGYKNGTSKAVVGNITIPARTYSIPRAPKSVTFARSSDTSQKITWTSDYDDSYGAQPWTGVYVDRRVDDGSWVTIATLGWEATNYTDGSTAAGHKYEYGVRSYNPAGASNRVTGVLYTTPSAPTSVTLTKTSETGLSLSASGGSSYYDSWEYQTQLNEGGWSGVVSAASLPASFDLGGGVVRARVRKLKASGGSGSVTLRSAWASSDAVTTTVAPSAPTVSLGSSLVTLGETQQVSWSKNHPDGSEQSQAEVELTDPDGSTEVTEVPGAASSCMLDASELVAAGTYKVRVRTHGLSADWGAWSSYVAFQVAALPSAEFVSPATGAVISVLPMEIAWTATDASGISAQLLELLDAFGVVVASWRPASAVSSMLLSSNDYALENGKSYSLRLTVTNGYMLSSTVTREFTTSFLAPASPSATVSYDEACGAHVNVSYGSGTDVETAWVTVERVTPSGTAALGGELSDGQSVIDRVPPLNTDYSYRITAHAESGATASATVSARIDARGVVANFGRDASSAVVLRAFGSYSESAELAGDSYHFADGGAREGLPVFYGVDELDASYSYSFSEWDPDVIAAVRSVSRAHHTGWLRDPMGNVRYGHLVWSLSASAGTPTVLDVTCKLTETAWEEPDNE